MVTARILVATSVWLALLIGSVADAATSSTQVLGPMTYAAQALTAYGGDVVFSQSDAASKSWRLMVWHAGQVSALPVPPRSVPFDADAGPDATGRPAVVYSRCAVEAAPPFTDWTRAVGCHIYEASLLGGSERRVKAIGADNASDSTPSIWGDAIAFARYQGSDIARIYIWRPGRPLRPMGGGSVPCRPARKCRAPVFPRTEAWVGGLDLGRRELVFSWHLQGENVFGTGGSTELRIDPVGRGKPVLAAVGTAGEACTGGQSSYMRSPNAVGDHALYVVALSDPCAGDASFFETFTPSTRRWSFNSPQPGIIGAAARDGATTYWISVRLTPSTPPPGLDKPENQGDCLPEHETCTLMQTTNLGLRPRPRHYKPSPPLD